MRLYFARHGESEANILHVFSSRKGKHGLTPTGIQQAEQLALQLQGISFAGLYSSPLLRATQTAEILSQRLAIPVQIADALREFDVGIFEGRSDRTSWQTFIDLLGAWRKGHRWSEGIEGGESYNDIRHRFFPFITDLKKTYQDKKVNLLLVTHGGILRTMLPLLLPNIDQTRAWESQLDYTTCIVAELYRDTWFCRQWGDEI
jgi:broad specificity phosphatase PhoE